MDEYFCTNCGADLDEQPGFDPALGTWTCTECGQFLMDDDIAAGERFEGVAWRCDECDALLNRQPGFSDLYSSWTCTKCGHTNGITEDDILEKEHQCPNCGANLKKQYDYSEYTHDYICSECDIALHRDYTGDQLSVVEDEYLCPKCGSSLLSQSGYSNWYDDYTCDECGTKLHRKYSSDSYTVAMKDVCPRCGDDLNEQYEFDEDLEDYTCSACGAELHRDYSSEPFVDKGKDVCPRCGDDLTEQYEFDEDLEDYTCSECGAELHRDYSSEPFVDKGKDKCPSCGDDLTEQYEFDEDLEDYTCSACGAELHRDYNSEPFVDKGKDECPSSGADFTEQYDYNEYSKKHTYSECGFKWNRDYYDDISGVKEDYESSDYKSQYHSEPVPIYYGDARNKEIQAERHRQQLRELELQRQKKAIRRARREDAWKRFWNIIFGKKLVVPLSSASCKGKQFEDIVQIFTDAGFVRVLTKPVDDLRTDKNISMGKVIDVSIKNSEFDALSRFKITSPIVVTYHDVHVSKVPASNRKFKKKDIKFVVSSFKNSGFFNIKAIPLNDLSPKRSKNNGKVVSVCINGNNKYLRRKRIRIDSEIQIKYHSLKL